MKNNKGVFMKKTLLIFLTFALSSIAYAKNIEMQCNIKSTALIVMNNGKPSLDYSTLKGKNIDIFIGSTKRNILYSAKLDDEKSYGIDLEHSISLNRNYEWIKEMISKDKVEVVRYLNDQYQVIKITNDSIDAKYFAQWNFGWVDKSFRLQRYYKDDWQGTYISHIGDSSIIFGLDCRSKSSDVDGFIQFMQKNIKGHDNNKL